MSNESILIVESNTQILNLLERVLSEKGYQLIMAQRGAIALRIFKERKPSLVLLDLMLPDMDGFMVCQNIRQLSNVPIIILANKDQEDYMIKSYEIGADDYFAKPFSWRVLSARIRALLNRSIQRVGYMPSFFHNREKDLVIDFRRNTVKLKGNLVPLSMTEFKILSFFVRNSGKELSASEIYSEIWGQNFDDDTIIVRVNIARLRQKLDDTEKEYQFIKNGTKSGYIFTLTSETEPYTQSPVLRM